ncbi:hypothetical protein ACHWP0_07730 [Weissella cibaria]|uniref:hypothetical protein n=1 Tax=Weissella cibaria TaxID=137591 RepID=UPI00376EC1C9
MIKLQIESPTTTYDLQILTDKTTVALSVSASDLPTVTNFSLTTVDEDMARYFENYIAAQVASRFQPKMANTQFLSELQTLVSTLLANWQASATPLDD